MEMPTKMKRELCKPCQKYTFRVYSSPVETLKACRPSPLLLPRPQTKLSWLPICPLSLMSLIISGHESLRREALVHMLRPS